ncbi:MAG: Uncharacterised protein [Cryomorphaceae bacterium]|nr:MAG: Uncharacterised protein [Cryomorphaceae bacterium]|tara:strand:- start:2041 stop:2778 length:738 start_codon:yes stop_codon:yes gene_type:complete
MNKLVLYLFFIVFASSCVTKNIAEVAFSVSPVNAKELIERVNSSNRPSEHLALKGMVSLMIEKDNEVSLGISIRVRKDSLIWASVTAPFGIELFRAVITMDSIYYINRTNKTYFIKPITNISEILKTDIAFKEIQEIVTATPKIEKKEYSLNKTDDDFLLTTQDYMYTVSNFYRIRKGVLIEEGNSLIYTYSNFSFENDFPEQLEIIVKSSFQNAFNIKLNYSKVVFDKQQQTPFKIPSSYVVAE